jgi:hypothetical protein
MKSALAAALSSIQALQKRVQVHRFEDAMPPGNAERSRR